MPRYNPGECKTYVIVAPDGGFLAWYNVFIAFLQYCLVNGVSLCLFANANFRRRYSYFNALFMALTQLFIPLGCALINTFGFRCVSLTGAISSALLIGSCSLIESRLITGLIFGIGGGVGCSMLLCCALVLPNIWFSRRRVIANSLASFGLPVGQLVMPVLMSATVSSAEPNRSFRLTFTFLGCSFIPLIIATPFMGTLKASPVIVLGPKKDPSNSSRCKDQKNQLPKKNSNTKSVTFHDYLVASEIAHSPHMLTESQTYRLFNVHSNICYPSVQDIVGLSSLEVVVVKKHQINCADYPMRREKNILSDEYLKITQNRKVKDPHGTRPFYRTDIFFGGNIGHLNKYRIQDTQLDYHMAITRALTEMDLQQETKKISLKREAYFRVLATMLDFSLLSKLPMSYLLVCYSLISIGNRSPYLFLQERGTSFGFDLTYTLWLYFFFGFGHLFGKVVTSLILVFENMLNEEFLYANILLFCGASTIASTYTTFYNYHILYSVILGIVTGLDPPLRTICLFKIVGLDNLTNGVGLQRLLESISLLVGLLISVELNNYFGDFKYVYMVAGSSLIIAAILLYPIKMIKTCTRNKTFVYV